jgi:DNA polymerase-3 subunit gamma/tau
LKRTKKKNLIKPIVPVQQSAAGQPAANHQPIGQPKAPTNEPPQPKRPVYRTTSLKQLGTEKETVNAPPPTVHSNDTSNDFSQDELVKHWIEYANGLTVEKVHLKNTLINCKPELKDNFLLEVSVYNPSQKEEIFENSAQILGHLHSKLHNNRIKMDIRIA